MPMFFCAQVDGTGLHRPGRGRHLADPDDESLCKLMGCSAAMASALIYHVNGPDEWITQHSMTGLHFWLTNLLSQRVPQLAHLPPFAMRMNTNMLHNQEAYLLSNAMQWIHRIYTRTLDMGN